MAIPVRSIIEANVAGPPSPLYGASADTPEDPAAPVPATVDIMPVLAVTSRMR